MKGLLKTAEGVFYLSPKVTTVGREGCDLIVQHSELDHQHAVIEYSEDEKCFVLQDLNTAHGTYVNDCRVQNAAVRLAPGDIIQFGNSGQTYELEVESGSQTYRLSPQPNTLSKVAYPPVHQRTAWTQPLTVITDQAPPTILGPNQAINNHTLPNLKSVVSSQTATWSASPQPGPGPNQGGQTVGWSGSATQPVYPRPPTSLRSRPLSAGSRRPTYMEQTGSSRICAGSDRSCVNNTNNTQRHIQGVGWVMGGNAPRTITTTPQTADISIVQEKEQRILQLNDEVKRLAAYESECNRKEEMIKQLKDEIGDLQGHLRQRDTSHVQTTMFTSDVDFRQRLLLLEEEVQLKKTEIYSLKEQINRMKDGGQSAVGSVSRQDLNDRVMEINSLKTELERVRKDKNITSGLVTQMQRDMANKDTTISRITREMEAVKNEMKEKENQLASMQAKFRRTQETKKTEEDIEKMTGELGSLRQKFKASEKKIEEQHDLVASLKNELDKVKGLASTDKENQKKIQSDLDEAKTKCQDIERAERMVRVDLEQVSKRIERFRNRVIQVTFSTPGIKAPDTEITDDELLDTLKKLMEERTEMYQKVKNMKQSVSEANAAKKDLVENSKKIKQQINSAVLRLREKGQTCKGLRQELDLLGCVTVDDTVAGVKEGIIELLQASMAWQHDIEAALENCGINIKVSDDTPHTHIMTIHQACKVAQEQHDNVRQQMADMDNKHKDEIANAMDVLRQELEDAKTAEVERIKLQSEEQLKIRLGEIVDREAELRDSAVELERTKITELELCIENMKGAMLAREDDEAANKEATKEALDTVSQYQKLETELREQITLLESSKSEEATRLQEELSKAMKQSSMDVNTFKEQIQQHSVTIVAMEERLNKVMKKNKDYQSEISRLKETIGELRTKSSSRPPAPPKPKVIIQKPALDAAAMETTVLNLQRENGDLKRNLQEQHDVILNLRRDLAGASAKLSDMTGELSEGQKEALEQGKKTINTQQVELMELRQQMAKLSEIIDKQSNEIKLLTEDLGKHRSALNKNKNVSNEQTLRIQELEEDLAREKEECKKSLKLVEEEGHITSELTALGAQCRGERHEQVIARQREALTELRTRIKALEQSKPPLPSQDQALQQVVMLKKELSEIRASQALQESAGADMTPLEHHINKTRGMDPKNDVEADHERSAHRETMEALEISEQSYLTLLRAIASALELDDIGGLRSMSHIPKDERLRLARERETSVELLTSRVKVLLERIARKDDLLQGYEKDLAKLRQAEKLVEQKHSQVESLASDVRSRTEESQYLRESLNRTKDRLDQEKRLNSNIKAKKTFHLENERVSKRGWPRHQCPPEDILGKEAAKKKASNERIKKKNYEIKTLKSELGTRERHLQDARRKLVTLESSLGYDNNRDPFEPPSAEV